MRRGDLFVLSWESLRLVEWGKVSSFFSFFYVFGVLPVINMLVHH